MEVDMIRSECHLGLEVDAVLVRLLVVQRHPRVRQVVHQVVPIPRGHRARLVQLEPHKNQKATRVNKRETPQRLPRCSQLYFPGRFKAKGRRSRHARVRKHRAVLPTSEPRRIVVAPGIGPPRGHSSSPSQSFPTLN